MSRWIDRFVSRRSFVVGSVGAGAALASTSVLAGCATSNPSSEATSTPSKLAIVHTNDSHGHDLLNDESLGLAAAAQLKKDYEAKGYEVLLLDAGDAAQGENLVNRSKGDTAIDFMNQCGYDVMTLGNHEFDYGQDKIEDYISAANFPILSANTIVDATGETIAEPNTTFTLTDGTKIGVFGLTTPMTTTGANPLLVNGLTFLDDQELYDCAQKQADALRSDGCKLVICLAHLGEEDEAKGNRTMDVIANTTGIDLVVDGHDHQEQNQLIKNAEGIDTLVVETGCHTHAVGVVTWENDTFSPILESFGSYKGQDATVAAYIQQVADDLYSELSEVVATTAFVLNGERAPGVRTGETNMGDLIADAMLWEAQQMADDEPDCAIINAGSIRQSLPEGDITIGDILNVLPYLNYICTVQVSGAALLEAIEASCAVNPEEMGAFPQVSGLTFTLDTTVPYEEGESYPQSLHPAPAKPGSRVTIEDVGGRGFDLNDTYTIAANDFMCAGGDTYYVFAEAAQATMKDINYLVSDSVRYYLEEAMNATVPDQYADPAGAGRITIIS